MANKIQIKRGMAADMETVILQRGELGVAFNEDETAANLYVGNGNGDNILLFEGIPHNGG